MPTFESAARRSACRFCGTGSVSAFSARSRERATSRSPSSRARIGSQGSSVRVTATKRDRRACFRFPNDLPRTIARMLRQVYRRADPRTEEAPRMPKASKETASETVEVEGYEGHLEELEGGYTVAFE